MAGETRPRRTGRRTLDRAAIVAAALDVIDDLGLDGLTMRNLGRELGVDPMAVYGHFEDKAALFDAVVEHEAARLGAVPGPLPDDPAEVIVAVWVHYRTVLLEHPHLAPLVASRPLPQEVWSEQVRLGLHLFRAAGVAEEHVPRVANAMTRFALGFVVREAGEAGHRAQLGESPERFRARLTAGACAPSDAPDLGPRTIAHLLDPAEAARDYEMGLRALLHGLGTHPSHLAR